MSTGCGSQSIRIERDIPYCDILPLLVNNDPRPAFSIPIHIRGMTVRDQHEQCMNLFTALARKHYGDNNDQVNLLEWTSEHGKQINRYFHSIGLMFNLWKTDINDPTLPDLEKRRYNRLHLTRQTKLSDLLYIIRINDSDQVFIISFDELPRSLPTNDTLNSTTTP